MTYLLYFEEKVHKKKLQRADVIPLLFPRLLCQILEHVGYPSEPQLERRRICRELFTLDKWNHLTAYVAPPRASYIPAPPELPHDEQPAQVQQAQQVEIPIEIIPPAHAAPSTVPTLEATSSAPPTTPEAPLVVPATSAPPPSKSSITISTLEFKGLCQTLHTLSTTQGALFQ